MRAVVLALLLLPATAHPQTPAPRQLPEPLVVDSPWGDFPLGRLQPGARLRLTAADGRRSTARLVTLGDSALDLQMVGVDSLVSVTVAELRALRAFEVRSLPVRRGRASTGGLIVGAAIGAIVGAAIHKGGRSTTDDDHRPGLGEDIAANASLGGLAGWLIGMHVIGGARWRPVALP
jgi:hypothetical protein